MPALVCECCSQNPWRQYPLSLVFTPFVMIEYGILYLPVNKIVTEIDHSKGSFLRICRAVIHCAHVSTSKLLHDGLSLLTCCISAVCLHQGYLAHFLEAYSAPQNQIWVQFSFFSVFHLLFLHFRYPTVGCLKLFLPFFGVETCFFWLFFAQLEGGSFLSVIVPGKPLCVCYFIPRFSKPVIFLLLIFSFSTASYD